MKKKKREKLWSVFPWKPLYYFFLPLKPLNLYTHTYKYMETKNTQ